MRLKKPVLCYFGMHNYSFPMWRRFRVKDRHGFDWREMTCCALQCKARFIELNRGVHR